MNFQSELFDGQDAYQAEHGCYPDIIFVRYDVWCAMFPVHLFKPENAIQVHGATYIALRTVNGPMFQFCDRDFMDRALNAIDPHNTPLSTLELLEEFRPNVADWNSNYATPVAVPYKPKTRTISIELMKRYKESF